MHYDSSASIAELEQGTYNVGINWRGKTITNFHLAAHECHNLVSVRFQATAFKPYYQSVLTSYIFGTVLHFTPKPFTLCLTDSSPISSGFLLASAVRRPLSKPSTRWAKAIR